MSMTKTLAALAIAALLSLAGVLAAEEGAAPSKDPALSERSESKGRIDALVKDLGADTSDVRDRATKELEKIGPATVPALKEAAKSDDPEVAWRARTILDHIEGGKGALSKDDRTDRDGGGRLQSFNFRIQPGAGNSSVVITQDGSGRVSVKVTGTEDGKPVTKTYEAESPEAFKGKYPDVAKQYGIGEEGRAPRVLRDFVPRPRLLEKWGFDEDFFDKDWPGDLGRDMDEMHERIRRQMDEVFRRHNLEPWVPRSPRPRARDGDEPPARSREESEAPPERAEAGREKAAPSSPATLGVRVAEVEPALRAQLKLGEQEGTLVEEVQAGSRAEKAGLKVHDVIISLGGTKVKGPWELRRVLRESAEAGTGGPLEVGILRGGERMSVPVKLSE
jgi:hypothetical protein